MFLHQTSSYLAALIRYNALTLLQAKLFLWKKVSAGQNYVRKSIFFPKTPKCQVSSFFGNLFIAWRFPCRLVLPSPNEAFNDCFRFDLLYWKLESYREFCYCWKSGETFFSLFHPVYWSLTRNHRGQKYKNWFSSC